MSFGYFDEEEEISFVELPDFSKEWEKHPMRKPYIASVTLNAAVGRSGQALDNAKQILAAITNREPSERKAKKSVRDFGIRQGEPIAAVVTLRKEEAYKQLKRLLEVKDFTLRSSNFDEFGNFAFGIKEHIDIAGTRYDPNLGIIGFNVVVKMARPGFRIHERRHQQKKVPRSHKLTREEAMRYIQDQFGVKIIQS